MINNKTIPISFRITPQQLGIALTGLLKQNPGDAYNKLSKITKECFITGLNDIIEKTNTNEISQAAIDILNQIKPEINFKE